jgi:hypothetical protein
MLKNCQELEKITFLEIILKLIVSYKFLSLYHQIKLNLGLKYSIIQLLRKPILQF